MHPHTGYRRTRPAAIVAVAALLAALVAGAYGSAAGQEASQWAFAEQSTPAELSGTARSLGASAAAPDGETQVLYGGWDLAAPSDPALADTWTWAGGEWTARCGTGALPGCGPGPRMYDGMATGPGGVVLYGGVSHQFGEAGLTPFTDTWVWDGSSWSQLCADGACGPVASAAPSVAGNGNLAVLFGGLDFGGGPAAVDDTWVLREGDSTWTAICGTGALPDCGPPARIAGSLAWDGEQWVLFSGSDGLGGTLIEDAWVLGANPDAGDTWTQVCGSGIGTPCGPDARTFGSFAYLARPDDAALRGSVLYGGQLLADEPMFWRDAWFWNGQAFSQLDVPWPSDPTSDPADGDVTFPVLSSRNAECQVLLFGLEVTGEEQFAATTNLGGWDLDDDGVPDGCQVAPTTTTTTTTTTPAPTTPTSPAPTAAPATLPATGGGGGTTAAVAAAVLGVLAGGALVLTIRRRRA